MSAAQNFISGVFSLIPPKQVNNITLFVEDLNGLIAYTQLGYIHLSTAYIENFQPQNASALRTEITGILYHEMTHIIQEADNVTPTGVIEGIADFIRLRAGYPSWVRQVGGAWEDGYSTTAFFFDWIDRNQTGAFVSRLNQKIGEAGWDMNFFVELTGKPVDTMWQEYQKFISS
ncbi:hypothetical protein Mapa_012781 [Marchantia paleacea]|nr:hypothetical protein Mapa_012781 [Marchantia paleacea]